MLFYPLLYWDSNSVLVHAIQWFSYEANIFPVSATFKIHSVGSVYIYSWQEVFLFFYFFWSGDSLWLACRTFQHCLYLWYMIWFFWQDSENFGQSLELDSCAGEMAQWPAIPAVLAQCNFLSIIPKAHSFLEDVNLLHIAVLHTCVVAHVIHTPSSM